MSETGWQVFVAETVTGKIVKQRLPFAGLRWSDSLDFSSGTSLSVTLPLEDTEQLNQARAVASGGWRVTLIAAYNGQGIVAGPITSAQVADDENSVVIGCAGPAALLSARVVLTPGYETDPEDPAAAVELGPLSLVAIARQILVNAITGTGRTLPFTVPTLTATEAFGEERRSYSNADINYAAEALKDLAEADGGPDIHFKPVLAGDNRTFTWQVRFGHPHLVDNERPRVWALGGAGTSMGENTDWSKLGNRWLVPGQVTQPSLTDENGQQVNLPRYTPVGVAEDLSELYLGMPVLERVQRQQAAGEVEQNTEALGAVAADLLRVNGVPSVVRPLKMRAEFPTRLGEYDLGDIGLVRVTKNDRWHAPGDGPLQRVLTISGTDSLDYTIGLADPMGAE